MMWTTESEGRDPFFVSVEMALKEQERVRSMAPFRKGERVLMTPEGEKVLIRLAKDTGRVGGTVMANQSQPLYVKVRRDGTNHGYYFSVDFWTRKRVSA